MKTLLTIFFLLSCLTIHAQVHPYMANVTCNGMLYLNSEPDNMHKCTKIKRNGFSDYCCFEGGKKGYYEYGQYHTYNRNPSDTRPRTIPSQVEECGRVNVCRQTSIAGMTCHTLNTCEVNEM